MRVRKAVIPAAGLGTRFLPATKAVPKEMLPVVDTPAIQLIVEEAVASGIESILIVTGRGKAAMEDHFDASFELERFLEARGKTAELASVRRIAAMARVCFVRQQEARGLGHAVLCARDWTGDEPFAVLLGDDLVRSRTPCLRQLLDVFEERGASVLGVMDVPRADVSKYGVVAGTPLGGGLVEVSGVVEKPRPEEAPSSTAIVGRYVLTPAIFDELERTGPGAGGEIQLTDAVRTLLSKEKVFALNFEGRRYDTGDRLGFLKATLAYALARPDVGPALREHLRDLADGGLEP